MDVEAVIPSALLTVVLTGAPGGCVPGSGIRGEGGDHTHTPYGPRRDDTEHVAFSIAGRHWLYGYMLSWLLLLQYLDRSPVAARAQLAAQLASLKCIDRLLSVVFRLVVPVTRPAAQYMAAVSATSPECMLSIVYYPPRAELTRISCHGSVGHPRGRRAGAAGRLCVHAGAYDSAGHV